MSIQDIQVQLFALDKANEDDFSKIIDLQLLGFAERNPGDKLPPRSLLQKQLELMNENPMATMEIYTAQNTNGGIDAVLMMGFPRPESPDFEEQKPMGMASLFVHPEKRRQGIGRLLLRKVLETFQARGIALIQGDSSSDAGRAFAKAFGATVALETKTSRAYVSEMNWEMIQHWADEGAKANPDVKIELYEGLPHEEDLEAYCKLLTEVNGQQPLEELEGVKTTFTPENMKQMLEQQKERGIQEFVMISRETNGIISGLSEVSYNPKRPHLIQQGLTGVQESYRGRSMGKWLKAKMLLYIRETYPGVEYIDTTNASVNEAMLSINTRIGFKLHRHNSLFKLKVEDAAARL